MESRDSSDVDLRDYLRVLSRRRGTILFAVMIVACVSLASALFQTPQYKATASVLLKPRSTDTLFTPSANLSSDPARDVQTQMQVVASQPVKSAVHTQLGVAPDVIVSLVGQTSVIGIAAQSSDPQTAATVANTYANSYIDYRRTQDINDALAAGSQIQARITDLQHQIDALNAQIKGADPKTVQSVTAAVAPQVDNLVQQQGTFKQQLGQLQVEAALKSGGAQIVSPATPPSTPVSPRVARDVALAILAGLMLGAGAAFVLEYLDDSLKTTDDLDRATPGLPTLAVIPQVPGWKTKDQPLIVTLSDPKSPAAEAYRALRTSIQFASLNEPMQIIQLTSPSAGEGKTTTAANLGIALTQVGQRVVIACCDLRRPRLHEFFGMDNTVGFTSVLLGEIPASAALQQVPGVDGLRILASGALPPNPSELLSSLRTAEVLTALRAEADIILIDSPPVLPVTDAAVLSGLVDSTLLVVAAGSTTRRQAAQAVAVLGQVGAPLLATVLNGLRAGGSYGSPYQYYRYERQTAKRFEMGPTRWRRGSRDAAQDWSRVDF